MSEILKIDDLHVTFKTRHKTIYAVQGVSFSLQKGSCIALVGESGCGKSVTARAIMRLLGSSVSEKGDLFYSGTSLRNLSEQEMRKIRGKEIATIFQDPMSSLNPTMKIGQQIIEGFLKHYPERHHEGEGRALELLRLVKIPQPETRIQQYPYELSGGMRQRVCIAIALASYPKILIADEPTTALDMTIQAQILELLKEIQTKTGTSIILITHDLGIVASLCSEVLVMYGGLIVEQSPTEELFYHPKHPYTQKLLAALPRLDQMQNSQLTALEGQPPDLSEEIEGCSFLTRCPRPLEKCSKERPSLVTLKADQKVRCFHSEKL